MKKWPPDVYSSGYFGPYPVNEIQQARRQLIQCLRPPHGQGLARVLPKIGIDSCFGPGLVPPPQQGVPNGLTPSGSYRLAAEKTPVTSPVSSVTSIASSVQSPAIQMSGWTPLRISRSISVQDTRQGHVHHAQMEGNHDSLVQNAFVKKRRYTEVYSAADRPDKRIKDDAELMGNRHSGGVDASVTKDNRIGEPNASNSSGTNLPLSHVYKCDYCKITGKSAAEITSHLTRSRHASASEYSVSATAGCCKSGPELQAIERMLAVSNPSRSNCAALVIACPECRSVFDDIFTCATHNKYEHGESDGCYAVCPVIHSENVEVSGSSCAACQQQFTDHNALVDHWLALPEHCPMPQSTDSRVFLVQTCPSCRRTFNDDFLDCVIHMAADHSSVTSVEVRHVMLPQRRERLPPFSCDIHSAGGLRDEAAVLSKLQNCFEQNAINARLEQIHMILAGAAT